MWSASLAAYRQGASLAAHTMHELLPRKRIQRAIDGDGVGVSGQLRNDLRDIQRPVTASKNFQHAKPNRGSPETGGAAASLLKNRRIASCVDLMHARRSRESGVPCGYGLPARVGYASGSKCENFESFFDIANTGWKPVSRRSQSVISRMQYTLRRCSAAHAVQNDFGVQHAVTAPSDFNRTSDVRWHFAFRQAFHPPALLADEMRMIRAAPGRSRTATIFLRHERDAPGPCGRTC